MLENANADLEDISRVKDEEKMQMTTNMKKLEGEKEALLKERSVSLPCVVVLCGCVVRMQTEEEVLCRRGGRWDLVLMVITVSCFTCPVSCHSFTTYQQATSHLPLPPQHTHTHTHHLPPIRRQTGRVPRELGENENDKVSRMPPSMKPPEALNKFSLYNTHTHTSVFFPFSSSCVELCTTNAPRRVP